MQYIITKKIHLSTYRKLLVHVDEITFIIRLMHSII